MGVTAGRLIRSQEQMKNDAAMNQLGRIIAGYGKALDLIMQVIVDNKDILKDTKELKEIMEAMKELEPKEENAGK